MLKMKFVDQACNFIKKETLALVFSCEFCEIFKNTFLTERLWTTASVLTIGDLYHMKKLAFLVLFWSIRWCWLANYVKNSEKYLE